MSRKLSKRAAAAAAVAEAAMVATAVRMEQQEQGRLSFFRHSLERNDVEIAALQDLHLTIQIAKRHLLRTCRRQPQQNNDDYYYYHSTDDDEEDCLLLLDLGQGKIRLTADKEGLEDSSTSTAKAPNDSNDPNSNRNKKSLVSKLSPEAYHWSYDFLLRLQLRRQLLNRLMRRLQRTAVLMDASAAADTTIQDGNGNGNNNNNNNKADAVAMAALVQAPLPPKYGDLRLHMDAREIQEFQLHWERQEQARIQIELQRESFYTKQAHALQELDKTAAPVEAAEVAAATVTAAAAIDSPTTKETDNGADATEEAADGAAAAAATATASTDDTAAVKQPATDEMAVDDREVPPATKETTAKAATTSDDSGNVVDDNEVPPATKETAKAATTSDVSGNMVDEEAKVGAVDTPAKVQETAANDTPMVAATNDEDNRKAEQEQQQEQPTVAIVPSPPLAPVSSTTLDTTAATAMDDNDNDVAKDVVNADDESEIDYESYREYMNAYEKIIYPTTGQVQYTLLTEDGEDAQTTPNKTGNKNKKKKNMPDFSTFIGPGIGATVHRTMSTQEKEAEYERWSAALLARIPQQPTLAELGLEHQVFFAKQRRQRAKQRRLERVAKLKATAAAAAAKEASNATATTGAVTAPFISPGKKLRNQVVEEDDANVKDEDNNDVDIDAPTSPSVSSRNKQDNDEDSKKDDNNDKQGDGDAKKNVDDDSKIAREDDSDGMDVDVTDNQGKETEVKDEAAIVVDDVKEKQESEDEQEKDVSSDEEEESDEDIEESQQTKDNEENEDSPSKMAAASGEKPKADEEEDDDDDDDDDEKPPTNLKKRPIILTPTPSFYEQDLKRVRLVHTEIMRSSMADHGRRKIKDATQDYNSALQVSSDLYARQKQLHAQLHAFTADTRNEVAKMHNQYEVDLAVARSQWNRRRIDFEQKKLQRLMPERNNPNYRAEGTAMTKMYETQQDPVKQIVSSTVAHIVDAVELIATCRLQNDRFNEEFRPPPPSADSAVAKNGQVEASIRQEIAKLAIQLHSSEEDRQRAWKRMLKIKTEFSGVLGPNLEGGPPSHAHYQQQHQQPQHHPSMPLPNLHQSSRQSFPHEAAVASHNLPSFAPTRAPRHPARRPSIVPLSSTTAPPEYTFSADPAGSDSKYSAARVRERISSDGTVAPVTTPKKTKEGLYQRPAGRTRKGMEWDAVRGIWVPADQQTTFVQVQPDMMAWQQHPPQG